MPRKLRVEYAGAIYHVMNRGNRGGLIFEDDKDRELFLATLGETCGKTGWQIHAYCLMGNHFHLVVETPLGNLVAGMRWFLGTYTARFNRRHKVFGHLFSGRYKSLIVDGSGNGYLKTVCDYVHLNPVRAKLLRREQKLSEYPWSSWKEYLNKPGKRPRWLRVNRLLGECGIEDDKGIGRRELESGMEQRRELEQSQKSGDWERMRSGWCYGTDGFRSKLLELVEQKKGENHYGEELKESDEQKAERIVAETMKKKGWREKNLTNMGKGEESKARLAWRLRNETTMTWKWIAERLRMGHWRTAANAVRRLRLMEGDSISHL